MADGDKSTAYSTIGTDEAKRLIDQGTRVIDVRQPDEWQEGHIAQATLLPLNGPVPFDKALQQLALPQDEEVIFVCAGGFRSATASEVATQLGLKKVYNLANGMHGWSGRNYPTTR
jgi:rhodanese-related sulfurtransferase